MNKFYVHQFSKINLSSLYTFYTVVYRMTENSVKLWRLQCRVGNLQSSGRGRICPEHFGHFEQILRQKTTKTRPDSE